MDLLNIQMTLLPLVWPIIVSCLFFLAIPDLMRRGLFFGVTVSPEFANSDLAREIRRRYRIAICIVTPIAIAIPIAATLAGTGSASAPSALAMFTTHAGLRHIPSVLQIAVALCAFGWANRATRPHATQRPSVVKVDLSTRPEPTAVIAAAFVIPVASLAALAVWTALRWGDLPSQLAVHWSVVGPDRWVATTPTAVATLLSLSTMACLLCALLAWGVLHGSRRITMFGEAALRERRFRMRTVILLLVAEYFALVPAWASLVGASATIMRLWLVIGTFTILALVARLLLAGQGGSRGLPPNSDAPLGDRTDDRHWSWGLIYFNRADPAFLVEKRFGVGYTFNFAHPFAWAIIALITVIPMIGRLL